MTQKDTGGEINKIKITLRGDPFGKAVYSGKVTNKSYDYSSDSSTSTMDRYRPWNDPTMPRNYGPTQQKGWYNPGKPYADSDSDIDPKY